MSNRTRLTKLLTFRRPAGSDTEKEFIRRYIENLGAEPDEFGNYILRIGDAPVLWAAHTDTVHVNAGRQALQTHKAAVYAVEPDSQCLGADDGTGVWILREMVRAGVPGLYVWHRQEESGAVGASHIFRNTPDLLNGIDYAIEFDRRGYDSVITYQGGRVTASDEFARALANVLNNKIGIDTYAPDPTGIFTDVERYADIVPEVTNISVGYHCAHSSSEWQDMVFAEKVLDAFLTLDVEELPVVRKPAPKTISVSSAWEDESSTWEDQLFPDEQWWAEKHGLSPDDRCPLCGFPISTGAKTYYWNGEEICQDCNMAILDPYLDVGT